MKAVVSLGLSNLSVPKKIIRTRFIVTSMTGNTNFATPSPALAVITSNVNALEVAALTAQGGGADHTASRRTKEAILDLSMKALSAYVESIANANPANAQSIILSAGMDVKGKGGRIAREFEVTVTGRPGEIKLEYQSIKRGTYEFQMTTDPNTETSWNKIYAGTVGQFVKSGLTSGTRYYFRSTAIGKNGQAPWSQVKNSIAL